MSIGIDEAGASIVFASGVMTYAVDAAYVCLIFNGTCAQQQVPRFAAGGGPRGYIEGYVIR